MSTTRGRLSTGCPLTCGGHAGCVHSVKDGSADDTVAVRLLLRTIYKLVLGDYQSDEEVRALHAAHLRAYVERGVAEELLDPRLGTLSDPDALGADREPANDELLKY